MPSLSLPKKSHRKQQELPRCNKTTTAYKRLMPLHHPRNVLRRKFVILRSNIAETTGVPAFWLDTGLLYFTMKHQNR